MTIALENYERPRRSACDRDLWEAEVGRLVCRPCEDRTAKRPTELGPLFARLNTTTALRPGAGRSASDAPTGGGRTAPVPLRLEVLSLAARGGVAVLPAQAGVVRYSSV